MHSERKRLLEAAFEEFSEIGPDSSTLKSVAERAGLDVRAARALFPDKISLLKTLLEETSDPLISAISLAVDNIDNPRDMILEAIRLLDNWLFDNPSYVRLLQRCMLDGSEVLGTIYTHSMYPSDFFEKLQTFVRTGQICQKDVLMVMVLLDSIILFPHMMKPGLVAMAEGESEASVFDRKFRAIADLLEKGLFSEES